MTRPSLIAALVAATVLTLPACRKAADVESVDTAGPTLVRAQSVKIESIRATVNTAATVAPSPGTDWTIIAPENGRIVELPRAEGDLVKEGELLARFEVPALSVELAQRQLDVMQANNRAQTARANDTRLSGLLARGIAPQRDADDARRERTEADTALAQAQSAKEAVEAMATRVVVKARFAGVIAKRWHNPGDQVLASTEDPILRVIDPTRLEVVASMPVAQLPLISPGRAARIINPTDGSALDGTVISVPTIEGVATAGDVRIAIPAGTTTLTAGMALQVEILSEERAGAMVIPTAAIQRDGADTFVMIAGTDGKAHRKSVKVGLVDRERAQILSGVMTGESVILAGAELIPDGAPITIQK